MPKRDEPSLHRVVAERAKHMAKRNGRPPPSPPPRLSHFAENAIPIRLECDACRHKVDRPAEHWIALFGDVTLPVVEARGRCSACGRRDLVDARPLYGDG